MRPNDDSEIKAKAEEAMVEWIDNATYRDLLEKWRFASQNDPFLTGRVGLHYLTVMTAKADQLSDKEKVNISEDVGFDTNEEVR